MHKTTIHIPKDKESIYGSVPDWIVMLGVFTILYSEAESAFIFSIYIHFSLCYNNFVFYRNDSG